MRFYLKRKNDMVDAVMEWDENNNTFTVLRGSLVSETIATHTKFRSAKSVKAARENGAVIERCVMRDMCFKSASSAANFVTGASTNGLVSWKNKDGKTIKEIIEDNN